MRDSRASIRRIETLPAILAIFACLASAASVAATPRAPAPASRPVRAARVPLFFVPNQGQVPADVRFQISGGSRTVRFTSGGLRSWVRSPASDSEARPSPRKGSTLDVTRRGKSDARIESLRFVGAAAGTPVVGLDPIGATVNFFRGSDPATWRVGLPAYSAIVYRGLYPGIDLRFDADDGHLRGAFLVAPGADPSAVRWAFEGAPVRRSSAAKASSPRPSAWQPSAALRRPVEVVAATREDGTRGMLFPAGFDASRPLLVDARILDSTFLGGGGDDIAYSVAVDDSGAAYVTGTTVSADFPADGFDTDCGSDGTCDGGLGDAFVAKIDPSLEGASSLVYATYLGGNGDDVGVSIAVEPGGSVLVGGIARGGFPTTASAYQGSFGSATGTGADGFLTRLDAAGSALLYSTYLGGSSGDGIWGVASDGAGNAWVTGQTYSSDFPATDGALDESCGSDAACDGKSDAFVARIDTTKSGSASLVFATFLGGSDDDQGFGVARGPSGSIAVAGRTLSTDFPALHGFQPPGGGFDGFLALLDADGTELKYATDIGGTGYEDAYAIAFDGDGDLNVAGTTGSGDLRTTPSAFQRNFGGVFDAYLAVVDPSRDGAESLRYASYFGGSGDDEVFGLRRDEKRVDLAGFSASGDLPARGCPLQPGNGGGYDAFLARILPGGDGAGSLAFASDLGGLGTDAAYGIAGASAADLVLVGQTSSSDFPLANSADETLGAPTDVFLTEIALVLPEPASVTPTSGPASGGSALTIGGAHFADGAGVSVGGAAAGGVGFTDETEMHASTPALAPGTLNDLAVGNPDACSGTLSKAFLADFLDVPAAYLFHDAVEKIFRAGITSGCGAGTYCPDAAVTRDQMAIFILRGKHGRSYQPSPATGTAFGDVPAGAFGAAWIEQILAEQITTGCGQGNYCPTAPVNRASMAVMLLRARHGGGYLPPDAVGLFDDVPATDPFARWIERLAAEGITAGCGMSLFCPSKPTTRGEMARFLVRAFASP